MDVDLGLYIRQLVAVRQRIAGKGLFVLSAEIENLTTGLMNVLIDHETRLKRLEAAR
jgi:hypothetical protein